MPTRTRDTVESEALHAQQAASPSETPQHTCLCGKPASRRCTKCKHAYYCSQDCQRTDWVERGHSKDCAAWSSIYCDLQGLSMTMKAGRLTEARRHCDNIFRACDTVDCPLALLAALNLKATCHMHGNDLAAAEALYQQSLAGAENLETVIQAHPEWLDSQARWADQNAGCPNAGVLSKTSDTVTRIDVLKQQGSCHTGLAAVARHKGNLEAAITSSEQAMSVALELGDRSLQASALSALGTATFHIDRCASARQVVERYVNFRHRR